MENHTAACAPRNDYPPRSGSTPAPYAARASRGVPDPWRVRRDAVLTILAGLPAGETLTTPQVAGRMSDNEEQGYNAGLARKDLNELERYGLARCVGHPKQWSASPAASLGEGHRESFTLDRVALREHLVDEGDGAVAVGLGDTPESCGADSIADAVSTADVAGAIGGAADSEVAVYVEGNSLVIAVREEKTDYGLAEPARQISRWSVPARQLIDEASGTFAGLCNTIEVVLDYASRLLPTVRALQLLERHHEEIAARCAATPGGETLAATVRQMGRALAAPVATQGDAPARRGASAALSGEVAENQCRGAAHPSGAPTTIEEVL